MISMIIVPSSDLRNRYTEITDRCIETGEPIYLTKNGYGHMVLLSQEQYEKLVDDVLSAELDKSLKDIKEGRGLTTEELMSKVKKDLGI